MNKLNKKELKACFKALWRANLDQTKDTLVYNYNNCWLTINKGRDGNYYAWYCYGSDNIAVNVDTLEELTEKEIEEQFC